MAKKRDIIIIGAGASGMMSAILCGQRKKRVLILEQKDKVGKKLLATGNGKCNYTNIEQHKHCYHSKDLSSTMKILNEFNVKDTLAFFQEIGIYPKIKNGYCYPNSQQASSVVEALKIQLSDLNIEIECNKKIQSIGKRKEIFIIKTDKEIYESEKVIIATGGKAASKLGSDGSGYQLAKGLGHTMITPMPALTALKCKETYLKNLAGVRTDGIIKLYWDGVRKAEDKGEIQLTNYGISGIPVFQVSRFGAEGLLFKKKVTAQLDIMPNMELEQLEAELIRRFRKKSKQTALEAMTGLLNSKINAVLLKEVNILADEKANIIAEEKIKKLAEFIKRMILHITDTNGFEQAQVTAGGIPLSEINIKTMESIKTKGLYFCGEILDVDGICGGYNLQWAWSSGYLAGKNASSYKASIKEKIE